MGRSAEMVLDLCGTRAELSEKIPPSTRILARLFREQLGTTPARYVESARVEAAKALLRSGHTVSAAAARSGFGSTETLRRVFAAQVGVSPSAYASEDVPDRSSATVPAAPV